MELTEALRTTGAIRDFTEQPVDDGVLARVLDTARFAPSGGNAQAWRVVVVRDPATRRRLGDLYRQGMTEYAAMAAAGLRPWAPTNDRDAEARALAAAPGGDGTAAGGFAQWFDRAPVLLAVFVDLSLLAAMDRDAARYSFAGGASIYPFTWNILLAARDQGLGGVITTILIRAEGDVKTLLGARDPLALAAVIALGYPVRQPRRLSRAPVSAFATVDSVDGPVFGASG
ncbi:NADH dehydrogenase FAD-containing subunit [Mycobacterium heckeshornense]|uniref:Nitroreductase n=1 Tax=Mycobacterium heckeshornense TaxID=110505 RepID=A0A2G8B704_9MYCO|nr:nitroreductase family protein [Mycobacterium heckeshornense]KMV21839.1 NADH dehydrogenase [Mycobacterium heckeshornense]MCV7035801.1 nitroreductase family protein [Mycobacterium heckeshornense]PIJ33549.1 NADH dehydrogenase FAD-containing subunit [Mycobacterium heckeshornense]BCO36627.1 nitroreductase [Mycobacterium heckeshornense]BCQ09518.1 oxidoreductase [Mycobacterium heckeshornense]